MKKFERQKFGKYEMIFPFSNESELASIEINKSSGSSGRQINMNGPNHMRSLVNLIKIYYDERQIFVKNYC